MTCPIIFTNFLPEIEQYDPEYAYIKEKTIFNNDEQIVSFYNAVKLDYDKHIINRNNNYHPSLLHKAIRDDDIDSFQSLISKNNYKINEPIEFSFYERSQTCESDIKPIKIAAIYKSIKIFKFLLMNDAEIDNNLLDYALYGSDLDIIHLSENMCPGKEICLQSIYSHDQELLEYSIENYNDNTEEDQIVSDAMQNFENEKEEKDNENNYNALNIENLIHGFSSYNYQTITTCLDKFVFMSQNIEQFDQHFKCDRTFLFLLNLM